MKVKTEQLVALMKKITDLQTEMEADEAKNTQENRDQFKAWYDEAITLKESIRVEAGILGIQEFLNEPTGAAKSALFGGGPGDGEFSQRFGAKSIGEQIVEAEGYKTLIAELKGGKLKPHTRLGVDAKGFLFPAGRKATFTETGAGLLSGLAYVPGVIEKEQQRLYIRDLLSVGETTLNSVPYIQETAFTNAADTVAEEGEKPEATLNIEDATAPVKKIAVVLKVTDEMFADFPMLRDYINGRLRYMVLAKEEQQILYGTGAGSQITGILNSSPQTQSATSVGELNAIMKAKTKVRLTANGGGFEADGIVINPVDWEGLRLLQDQTNGQYFGGGPFTGAYGNGQFIEEPRVWGLRPVITEAITAGTALVGAFKLGATLWQREGVTMDATNSNEDDFNFNRITLRVEERIALAVWRPKAFCTVTDISF